MSTEYPIFGQSNSEALIPRSCNGIAGFFAVPPAWGLSNENGQIWATDLAGNRYAVTYDYDLTACFQDLYRTTMLAG